MAALDEGAEQRRPVAGTLGTEFNDIPPHGVDLVNDAETLEARAEHAGVALGQQPVQPCAIGFSDQVHGAADGPRTQQPCGPQGASGKARHTGAQRKSCGA